MWQYVTGELDRRGVPHIEADLPSCRATSPTVDVHDDAQYVRGLIDGPSVLVGNSYGGAVITEAGEGARHLVYVSALMPEAGEPLVGILRSMASPDVNSAISVREDGMYVIDAEADIPVSLSQAPPGAVELARAHGGRPMSLGPDPESVALRTAAWHDVPSTYVVCTEDRSIPADAQRAWAATRASESIERPWDHCPQLSHPGPLAEILERRAREA